MKNNRLFLTEVDHHHPRPLKDRRLRAYILQHSLFFDKLLVGDSQFNNNRHIRSLIWGQEPKPSASKNLLTDLSLLLQEGYLLPAIREDYESLQELRDEHDSRGVEDVPPRDFIKFVEEKIGSQRVSYDIKVVSKIFKERALGEFSSSKNFGRGKLSKEKLRRVHDYIANQDKLLYKSLRDWVEEEINNGNFTERDYRIIDRIVSGAYRHNVALSIDTNIDMPILESRDPFPISLKFGNPDQSTFTRQRQYIDSTEWHLPPAVHFSSSFLSQMPARALTYIKGSSNLGIKPLRSYKKIIKYFERFRAGREINFESFIDDLELYLTEVELVVLDCLENRAKANYLNRKRKAKEKAKINLMIEGALCAFGFIPVVGDIMGIFHAGYGSLKELRDAARQEEFINGYIAGRSNNIDEKLFLGFSEQTKNGA